MKSKIDPMGITESGGAWKGIIWEPMDGCGWDSAEAYDDAKDIVDAGIKWVRLSFRADEPFEILDKKIKIARDHDIHILACYSKANPVGDLGSEEEATEQIGHLKAVVSRYKTDIRYWEIQNEANLDSYWNLGGGAGRGSENPDTPYNQGVHRYVIWLSRAYQALKSVDAGLTVIMGGISEWMMEDFLKRLTVERAYRWFDAVAVHPYANINYGVNPDTVIMKLNHLKAEMALWPDSCKNMPIWVTEIGYSTERDWDCPGYVETEALKGEMLEKTMIKLIRNLSVPTPVFWYILHEIGPSNGFGLTKRAAGSPTVYQKSYYNYRSMDKSWDFYASHP